MYIYIYIYIYIYVYIVQKQCALPVSCITVITNQAMVS